MKLPRLRKQVQVDFPSHTFQRLALYSQKILNDTTVLVDIGVSDGRFIALTHNLFPNVSRKIGIDPISQYQHIIDFEYVQTVIGSTCGEIEFNISSDLFTSSKLYAGEKIHTVQQIRLECLLEKLGISTNEKIFVKIDAQGTDLDCLESAGKYINSIDLVLLELQMRPYTPEMNFFGDSVARLKDIGFEVCEFLDPVDRSYDGTLGQIDVLAAKKNSRIFEVLKW